MVNSQSLLHSRAQQYGGTVREMTDRPSNEADSIARSPHKLFATQLRGWWEGGEGCHWSVRRDAWARWGSAASMGAKKLRCTQSR